MKIFYNANIFTLDYPGATAFVIDNGAFIALGSNDEILESFPQSDALIDLQGKTVWPGLIDAHVHLRVLAESMAMVNCETQTIEECLERVKQRAAITPEGTWIRGHGWNQTQWEDGYGTAQTLDPFCSGRPAYLTAKSLHAAWANSKALELAGIDKNTPDPLGGSIQRDKFGQPTGILFERGAKQLVENIIPPSSDEETVSKIKAVIPELWKLGLVGVHDFDDFACWQALQSIYQDGELGLRVCKGIPHNRQDAFFKSGLRSGFGDDRLYLGSLKLFADGALGPHTAAMLNPYEGTRELGTLLQNEDELVEIGTTSAQSGFSLAIHAIGDRANRTVLNAFERIRAFEKEHNLPHYKHRIEHVQIIHPSDLPRLKQLDLVASMQPIHATSDMHMAEQFLGHRSESAYAYRSILDTGAQYVFGSDAPVEPINPFLGLHAAVTRRRLDGSPGVDGWQPFQKLSLKEALLGFSYYPAVISGRGERFGKISPGFYADFIVLSDDPFEQDPHELAQIKPLATFIDGECKYQIASF